MAVPDDVPEVDRLAGAPHPRDTLALIGQDAAEAAFLDAYRNGRFPHAWILAGPEGVGKATFAYRAARFVLSHPDPAAAGVQAARSLFIADDAPATRRIAAQAHTSLFVLRRRWNAERKSMPTVVPAELARKAVSFFETTAGEGGWRVCIVDSADDLNVQSANALLKVVEEPPPRSLFLIVAHMPGRLLPTIRSRCRMLRFRSLSPADVARAVEAASPGAYEPDRVARAAAVADGTVRGGYKALDEGTLAIVDHIRAALSRLPALDWSAIHAIGEGLAGRQNDAAFEIAIETMFAWLSERLHAGAVEPGARLAPLAEVWDKAARVVSETETYNVDRRALVLTLFSDLADALRACSAG